MAFFLELCNLHEAYQSIRKSKPLNRKFRLIAVEYNSASCLCCFALQKCDETEFFFVIDIFFVIELQVLYLWH